MVIIITRIMCEIERVSLKSEYFDGTTHEIDGIRATCSKCGHQTESNGSGTKSVNRCLVLMNRECSCGENNFYVSDTQDGVTK
jgi:hypothetical protein